jgi:demethylmenaquinone methyltransferase/2-methoxy-6-polyprenyl-1,4-benzoquinol methylase
MARAVPDEALARDPGRIERMFSAIVPRYDLMNRVMTAGLDRRWRRLAAREAALRLGEEALDACCGTGDLAFAVAAAYPGCRVTGVDFSGEMLARAREKAVSRGDAGRRVDFAAADLLALPFADDRFSAATVAFGVRNVADVARALRELRRVVRSGGRIVCLETVKAQPGAGGRVHGLWSERVVPFLGRVVAGQPAAYAYLPASVATFADADELAALMSRAGLVGVRYRRLGFGAVALHVGVVP